MPSWWVGVSRAEWGRRVARESPRINTDALEGVTIPRSWLDDDQVTLTRWRDVTKKEKPPCPHCDATESTELLYRMRTLPKETWYCSCCSKTFEVKTGDTQ